METRSHSDSLSQMARATACAVLAATTLSFGWTASGSVKSKDGKALAGVAVTSDDATALATTTDAAGAFDISSGTVSVFRLSADASWKVRIEGGRLEVRVPTDGPVSLALVGISGRETWSTTTRAVDGIVQAALPGQMGPSALWLRVRHAQGEFSQAILSTGNGFQVAPHLQAARQQAQNPVLKFSKAGYRDTTYSMQSSSESNLAIVLGDTGTSQVSCSGNKLSSGDQTRTLSIKGDSRTYILHVPSSYTGKSPAPLVVDFHPIGGTGSGEFNSSPYKGKTDPEGVISAYPNGKNGPMGGAWNVGPCCVANTDDTAFARAIVADIKSVGCVDPKRVYAVGFSMGGGMSHFNACHNADIFAAVAPAAFDLLKENQDACKPARPITVVSFRGTSDPIVPYAGGYSSVVQGMPINFLGAKATAAKWAELNKCTGSPSAEDANGCSTYSNCQGGVQVTLCTKQGGGHDYGNATVGWPILKKYTLP
ncbi:MAG: feruloyl esterase [Fibrobacteria bacterium]|nr:feruloyl esterase [Fibrobacteria bacterium]